MKWLFRAHLERVRLDGRAAVRSRPQPHDMRGHRHRSRELVAGVVRERDLCGHDHSVAEICCGRVSYSGRGSVSPPRSRALRRSPRSLADARSRHPSASRRARVPRRPRPAAPVRGATIAPARLRSLRTRPACSSNVRCFATAWRVTVVDAARRTDDCGPRSPSETTMPSRVGSPSAANTGATSSSTAVAVTGSARGTPRGIRLGCPIPACSTRSCSHGAPAAGRRSRSR